MATETIQEDGNMPPERCHGCKVYVTEDSNFVCPYCEEDFNE